MNKRKTHLWFGSRNRLDGSELVALSPNSGFNFQLNFPESMPRYSKYTIQVKQFVLQNVAQSAQIGVPNYEGNTTGESVCSCVVDLRGLPFEDNFIQRGGAGYNANNNNAENTAILTRIGLDVGSAGIGFGSVEPKTDQPKIVVGRLNGTAFCSVSLRDVMTEDIIIATPNALGGAARPIGRWACLLEIEGVDGYEECIHGATHSAPIATNGLNNQNHMGFQNNNKPITKLNPSFR